MTRFLVALSLALGAAACITHTPPLAATPKFPAYRMLEIPADLAIAPRARAQHEDGWRRLQAGDVRGASRDFSDVLKQTPDFYPAETGLGDVALADRQFKPAAEYFRSALAHNGRYLPALEGQIAAAAGLGDDVATMAALEQLLTVDPSREEARGRLDLLRLRTVQGAVADGTRARAAGRLDEAQGIFGRALQAAPSSAVILRELASVEVARGALEDAQTHVTKALELDRDDPDALAVWGSILEAQGKISDAVDAYARALSIDPRPAWREKHDALRTSLSLAALPPEYHAIHSAQTVTRAQVGAMIGIELQTVVEMAPRKATVIATDVRTHWAAPWILPVTQAGIMDVFPNHTFQPNATVQRSDLAQVVSHVLNVIATAHPQDAAKWRAERPRFNDVPPGHVSYTAIAEACAAGAMAVDATGRFWPARLASGTDLEMAVARLKQLAGR